jgi:hypothetical protein
MMNKNLQLLYRAACLLAFVSVTACGNGSDPTGTPASVDSAVPVILTAPGTCQAATVTWAVAGTTCTATISAAATGTNAAASDLVAPNFGAASFLCTDGKIAAQPVANLATSCLKADIQDATLHGYLFLGRKEAPQDYDGGFSMYTAAWPLYSKYPGTKAQSGLPGTWMFAKGEAPPEAYQTIEGGLGWWNDTVFGTETPKFHMGAVAIDFSSVSNGPGIGWGDFTAPSGKYGVAQLSPNLLWPPDGLNMKQGTNGELLGAGYLPLPFTNAKTTTAGQPNKPTGDNSWTLFLNAANFKGPATFVMPYFFSYVTTTNRKNARDKSFFVDTKQHLDSNPSDPNKAHQMETQYVPAYMSKDAKGDTYARVAPVQFPRDEKGNSVTNHRLMAYKKSALWDSVEAWFKKGGAATSSEIKLSESFEQAWENGGGSSWTIYTGAMEKANNKPLVEWSSFAKTVAFNTSTVGFSWTSSLVSKTDIGAGSVVTLPQYYRLKKNADGNTTWAVVQVKDVPVETGLTSVEFKRAVRNNPRAFTTPMDDSSLIRGENTWKIPGPSSGPYTAKLGDGTTVTYYWYKFMNQPTLLNSDLTLSEREEMQSRVEKLHQEWTITKEYLPAPTTGKLAEIDPALILAPPKGLEIGYVPIATRQEQTP